MCVRGARRSSRRSIARSITCTRAWSASRRPRPGASEGSIHATLRARLEALKERKRQIEEATLDVPEKARSFLFRAVPIEPGYPINEAIEQVRTDLNAEIKQANAQIDFPIPPVEVGQPFYVGNAQCQACHQPAYDFWQKDQPRARHPHARGAQQGL